MAGNIPFRLNLHLRSDVWPLSRAPGSEPRPSNKPMSCDHPCCCHHSHLTEQEIAVLELVALGLANEDIGRRMHLSGHTVAGHVGSAMRRLAARSRAELVARGYVYGLLANDTWPPRATGRRCFVSSLLETS